MVELRKPLPEPDTCGWTIARGWERASTKRPGHAEPEAALELVQEIAGWRRVTLGADKGYDRKALIQEHRDHQVTPHIARKTTSIIDARPTRHPGCA